ncbi:MAG: Signal transduction histidine kinase [Gemmatimonadetes bacterium]|nr:Signal transduction histidine kinase [Gemmatimonadota bacterium]
MHPLGAIEELSVELERRTSELERSERRFLDIVEHTADAIMVVDDDGVIRFANPVARSMFAGRRDDLVGTHFGFPLVTGETTELDLFSGGEPRVVEMRVVESEWEGSPALIASLRDITERKQVEENTRRLIREQTGRAAAEAAAQTLRFLADATTSLSSSLDYATTLTALAHLCVGRIADWSVVYALDESGEVRRLAVAHCEPDKEHLAREFQNIPIDRSTPHPVLDVLRSGSPKVVHAIQDEALDVMVPNVRERDVARALGLSSFLVVPMVARGHPLGAIALIASTPDRKFSEEDVTLATDIAGRAALAIDNARLYGNAQKANQSKTDFLAVVSHDLRTPLNAIVGYADLLDEGIPVPLPPESRQPVQRIRTSARHLMYLMNELLVFARLDGGSERADVKKCDVRNVAREVAVVMERQAQERGLTFRLLVSEGAADVETDADKLRQVLLNLAGNAVKYTEHGGVEIDVRTESAEHVDIVIHDTGQGIAPQHLEQIFEPFWQVDRTQRSQGGGTGLGLSVVRRMLDLLGGDIRVESALGEGSTFVVRVPRHPVRRDDEAGGPVRPPHKSNGEQDVTHQ